MGLVPTLMGGSPTVADLLFDLLRFLIAHNSKKEAAGKSNTAKQAAAKVSLVTLEYLRLLL